MSRPSVVRPDVEGKVLVAGGSALSRKRPLVLGALAVVLALAIAVSLAVTRPWASTKDRSDVAAPVPGDRVLQSVDVTMQSDGALTRVGDDVVIARAQGGRTDTYATTYDPGAVVDQLPVRVLTAYRTDQGSGTDLDDLKGYTGRVSIDLMVQNLTVKPQQITYDVAGRSRKSTALVGAPLTVVASAALPGVDPASVVTAAADISGATATDSRSTNGVLSRAQDSTTQVQWASILAPPQLGSTATFRLVVDAKDFAVPAVDLSVQPGLVTDPSVGALIDAAFNPKNSDELALETRTIALVGDVNDVLDRASGTISGVRKTLDSSSKTLGTKTVESLTLDTKTISTSLKTSSDDVDSLGDDLKKSLQTTQSATLQRMSETVSGLQDLIGDTSGTPPTVEVSGTGCAATVSAPTTGGGVYANLLSVSAQLDAYAKTTQGCKKELQTSIAATIGVVKKDGTPDCGASATSVVCSLQAAQAQFADAVEQVTADVDKAQSASDELDPAGAGTSAQQLRLLSRQLAALVDGLVADRASTKRGKEFQKEVDVAKLNDLELALKNAVDNPDAKQPSLKRVDDDLARVIKALGEINKTATDNAGAAPAKGGAPPPGPGEIDSMIEQNDALAARLCDLGAAGTLPPAEVEELRAYLVRMTCDGDFREDVPTTPAVRAPMVMRLRAQKEAWVEIRDQTSPEGDLVTALTGAQQDLADLATQLGDTSTSLGDTRTTLADVLKAIDAARKEADETAEDLTSLSDHVVGLEIRYDSSRAELGTALDEAKTDASTAQATDLTKAIKQVDDQRTVTNKDLDKAFAASAAGLSAAADGLRDGAGGTLKQQRDVLAGQKQDQAEVSSRTKAGLAQVSSSVTSATRDLDSTRTSLSKDLDNVLLDLGNPKQPGKGLLGTLGKSARSADSADFQLGLASDTVSSYAAVRGQEVDGIQLRQAQAEAALQRQADLPAFATEMPANTSHRTVYEFHLGGER